MSDPREHIEDAILESLIRLEEEKITREGMQSLSAQKIAAVKGRLLAEKDAILANFDKALVLTQVKKSAAVKIWSSIGVAALALVGVGILFLNRGAGSVQARLAYIKGHAKINETAASLGTPIVQSSILTTDTKSLASVEWQDVGTTVLRSGAQVKVLKLERRDIPHIEIENLKGLTFSKVNKGVANFTVRTPTVILAVRGTGFSVNVTETGTILSVQEGVVEATLTTKPAAPLKVGARQKLAVTRGQAEAQVVALNDTEMAQLARLEKVAAGSATDAIATEIFADEANPAAPDGAKAVVKLTLDDIRKKYGKVSRVNLKSGASYTGFFVLKGEKIEIITPNGVVRVPTDQLRDVQDIN